MKKFIQIMGATVFSLFTISLIAQEPVKDQKEQPQTSGWDAKNNPVVQDIKAKYEDKLIAPKAAKTTEETFPVIGTYQSNENQEAKTITITLDEQNKGLVWIEGLPQGKIKAMLRKSPATYKIPAQKNAEDKEVAEGTLIFNTETNTLSICIGKNYNYENPSQVFDEPQQPADPVTTGINKTKGKKVITPKPWMYTGLKVVSETAKIK